MFKINELNGSLVRLEPLSTSHKEDLRIAGNDERIWKYMPQKAMHHEFDRWFQSHLEMAESGKQITYAIRDLRTQQIIGSSAFYDLSEEHRRLTLGYVWYVQAAWGTRVNSDVLLLMLKQAFEAWHIQRVEIGTDSRNILSYNTIKRLGATEEGLLRQHMILHDGAVTDTILFSIVDDEWPRVKQGLIKRLETIKQGRLCPSY